MIQVAPGATFINLFSFFNQNFEFSKKKYEDEDGLLCVKFDTLADDVDELADGEILGHEVLDFVNFLNVRPNRKSRIFWAKK